MSGPETGLYGKKCDVIYDVIIPFTKNFSDVKIAILTSERVNKYFDLLTCENFFIFLTTERIKNIFNLLRSERFILLLRPERFILLLRS